MSGVLERAIATYGRPYGGGVLVPPGGLDGDEAGAALVERLREYKLRVAKRYRAMSPDFTSASSPGSVERVLPEGRLFVSPKIDGELWFAVKVGDEAALVAPNGRVLSQIPVAADVAACFAKAAGDVIVAGEVFVATREGTRPRVFHVARALRDNAQAARIGFKAFDLVLAEGEDALAWPYERRLAELGRWFPASGRASLVQWVETDKRGIEARYQEWVASERFEGLVVRHEGGQIYKLKPELTIDAVVIAWSDRIVGERSELRELQVALMRDDGSYHLLGTVGSGLDDAARGYFHRRLTALAAESSYRLANREGTLCRFVQPEVVIELKCGDLLAPEPGEPPNLRMTLTFDPVGGWAPKEAIPLPSLIHPVFERERTDKRADKSDVGFDQIRQIVPPDSEAPPLKAGRPEPASDTRRAAVLVRKVWVKQTKGQTAVRKYVAWATHKAETDPRFPPFVVAFTDFAAGRKEPLQRELRVASSAEKLDAHIKAWEAENLKKGWSPVE